VHAPAGGADARGEAFLERRLPILVGQLDVPRAGGMLVAEPLQPVTDQDKVRMAQDGRSSR